MAERSEIEFVSYDGKYPNLCSGMLKVRINGIEHSFGDSSDDQTHGEFPKFWISGGARSFDIDDPGTCIKDKWQFGYANRKEFPEHIYAILNEIIDVMNSNVPYGCCGGCFKGADHE